MDYLSRWIGCLTLLLLQLGCSMQTSTAVVRREHYDPAYLNEAALTALAAGDRGTATILLERAAVVAPWDALIRENLAALRHGGVVRVVPARPVPAPAAVPGQSPGSKAAAAVVAEPALPAMTLWPLN